jgi:hypothetical protein
MSEHICNKEHPMSIELADKVHELGQHWVHEDVKELHPEWDFPRMYFKCNACGHEFTVEDFED